MIPLLLILLVGSSIDYTCSIKDKPTWVFIGEIIEVTKHPNGHETLILVERVIEDKAERCLMVVSDDRILLPKRVQVQVFGKTVLMGSENLPHLIVMDVVILKPA